MLNIVKYHFSLTQLFVFIENDSDVPAEGERVDTHRTYLANHAITSQACDSQEDNSHVTRVEHENERVLLELKQAVASENQNAKSACDLFGQSGFKSPISALRFEF